MNPECLEFGREDGREDGGSTVSESNVLENGCTSTGTNSTNLKFHGQVTSNEVSSVDIHKLTNDKLKKKLYDKMAHNNNDCVGFYQNPEMTSSPIKQEIWDCRTSYQKINEYMSESGKESFYGGHSAQTSVIRTPPSYQLTSPVRLTTSSPRQVTPPLSKAVPSQVMSPRPCEMEKIDLVENFSEKKIEGSKVFPSKMYPMNFTIHPPPAESCSFQFNKAQSTSKFQQTTLPSSSHVLAQANLPRMHDKLSSHSTQYSSHQQLYNKQPHSHHQQQQQLHQYQHELQNHPRGVEHHQQVNLHQHLHQQEQRQERHNHYHNQCHNSEFREERNNQQNEEQLSRVQHHQQFQRQEQLLIQKQQETQHEQHQQQPLNLEICREQKLELHQQQKLELHQQQKLELHQQQKLELHQQQKLELHQQQKLELHQQQKLELHQQQKLELHQQQKLELHQQQKLELHQQQKLELHQQQKLELHQPQKLELHQPQKLELHQPQKLELHQPQKLELHQPQKLELHQPQKLELHQQQKLELHQQQKLELHQQQKLELHQPQKLELHQQEILKFQQQQKLELQQLKHELIGQEKLISNQQQKLELYQPQKELIAQQKLNVHQEYSKQQLTQELIEQQKLGLQEKLELQHQQKQEFYRQQKIELLHQQKVAFLQQQKLNFHQQQTLETQKHDKQQNVLLKSQLQQQHFQWQVLQSPQQKLDFNPRQNLEIFTQKHQQQQQQQILQSQQQQQKLQLQQQQQKLQLQQQQQKLQLQQQQQKLQLQQQQKLQLKQQQQQNWQVPQLEQNVQLQQLQQNLQALEQKSLDKTQQQQQQNIQIQHPQKLHLQNESPQIFPNQQNTSLHQNQIKNNYRVIAEMIKTISSGENFTTNSTTTSCVYTIADCVKNKKDVTMTTPNQQSVIQKPICHPQTSKSSSTRTFTPVHRLHHQPGMSLKPKSNLIKTMFDKPPYSINSSITKTISMLSNPEMNERVSTTSIDGMDEIVEINERISMLKNNIKMEAPPCDCFSQSEFVPDRAPYYTHLGFGESLPALRQTLEKRFELEGKAIRIEKLGYTGREGKTTQGCPIAKWIIRRAGPEEKVLVLVKHRPGHHCATAWLVVVTVAWEGVPSDAADDLYNTLIYKLPNFGLPTTRRCGINELRTCACQGMDNNSGASFSFGCSWSMYYNGCKFARSKNIRKFRLKETSEESEVEEKLQNLATNLAPFYKKMAPDSYSNQTEFEEYGKDCRLGRNPGRPWSGVTACVDFCAHSHKDAHNMNNGCTVVVTLTKHRGFEKPEDEQLHVLPLYVLEPTDEFGSEDGQLKKMSDGSLEILKSYPMELRIRNTPLIRCRRSRTKKGGGKEEKTPKRKGLTQANSVQMNNNFVINQQRDNENFKRPLFPVSPLQSRVVATPEMMDVKPDIKVLNANLKKSFEKFDERVSNSGFHEPNLKVGEWKEKLRHEILRNSNNADCNKNQVTNSRDVNAYQSPLHLLSEAASIKCQQMDDQANTATLCDPNGNSIKLIFTPIKTSDTSENKLLDYSVRTPPLRPWSPRVQSPVSPVSPVNPCVRFGSSFMTRNVKPNPIDTSIQPSPNNKIVSPVNGSGAPPYVNQVDSCHLVPSPFPEAIPRVNSSQSISQRPANVENGQGNKLLQYLPYLNESRKDAKDVNKILRLPSLFSPVYNNAFGAAVVKDEPLDLLEAEFSTPPLSPEPINSEGYYEVHSENEENFSDEAIGGVAVALTHGSVLFECAKHELHATTALKHPNRLQPTRISLVFYQHKNLNLPNHGGDAYKRKMEKKFADERKMENLRENSDLVPPKMMKMSAKEEKSVVTKVNFTVPTHKLVTIPTVSLVSVFSIAPLIVTGPYQKWI